MKEERVKRILENLSDEYQSSNVLASRIGVSSKTIRNEIKDINMILKNQGAFIETKPKKGVRLVVTDFDVYSSYFDSLTVFNRDDIPSTQEQRVQQLRNNNFTRMTIL